MPSDFGAQLYVVAATFEIQTASILLAALVKTSREDVEGERRGKTSNVDSLGSEITRGWEMEEKFFFLSSRVKYIFISNNKKI